MSKPDFHIVNLFLTQAATLAVEERCPVAVSMSLTLPSGMGESWSLKGILTSHSDKSFLLSSLKDTISA